MSPVACELPDKMYGKKARESPVRACMGHEGAGFGVEEWQEVSGISRRITDLVPERGSGRAEALAAKNKGAPPPDPGLALVWRRLTGSGSPVEHAGPAGQRVNGVEPHTGIARHACRRELQAGARCSNLPPHEAV